MKTYCRRLLSLALAVVLCFGICMPAQAANENNVLGVTFDVELDTQTLYTSTEDQTVVMRLVASKPVTVDGIGFTAIKDSPLTIAGIRGGDKIGAFNAAATNLENGIAGWNSPDAENINNVTELAVITYLVPANTPAGSYQIGVSKLELTKDYGGDIWENAATATATLTIIDEIDGEGYSAGITTLTNSVSVEDAVTVNICVSHSSDTTFAAGEMEVHYDSAKLSFDKNASLLGGVSIRETPGCLLLEDYGADKNFGNGVYTLVFNALADGTADIEMISAAFVNKENAVKSDLIPAIISPSSVALTISKQNFTVALPSIFTGATSVICGENYSFSATDSDHYNYGTVSATMGGEPVNVIDNEDGTYSILNVTGNLVITGSRSEKSYSVTFSGNASEDIKDASTRATYNTDYSFIMPTAEGWAYRLDSITIGGNSYTGYQVEESVYTIPGSAIAGDIVISISKSATNASVTVEGTGAGTAAGYDPTARIGESYTLTITPEAGYTYEVTAVMAGEIVFVKNNGNHSYTIEKVTGNIVFNVDQIVVVDGVSVSEYLALDSTVMWLVKNETMLADGKVPTYDGNKMFWSEKYGTYCYLVIEPTLSLDEASEKVGITDGTAFEIDYSMDVNLTGKVDASDAQLTYNMYNAVYHEFNADVSIEKFLRADVNADCKINVEDAAAIIADILA